MVTRVSNKLTGRDFNPRVTLDVRTQVDKLIQQATSLENLCQCYIGWLVYSPRSLISPISQSLTLFILNFKQVCILVEVEKLALLLIANVKEIYCFVPGNQRRNQSNDG